MTAEIDLPGLAERCEQAAQGLWADNLNHILRCLREAAAALRAASAPAAVPVAPADLRKKIADIATEVWLGTADNVPEGWHDTGLKFADRFLALYAAPQSFTSGHIAGQREMQEARVTLIKFVAGLRQHEIRPDVRDELLNKIDSILSVASLPVSAGEIHESDGGVKESPASIPDYNGVKSPALVTAHGLSGKSCPLSRVAPGPSDPSPAPGGVTTVRKLVDDPNSASGKSLRDVEVPSAACHDHPMKRCSPENCCKRAALTAGEKAGAVAKGELVELREHSHGIVNAFVENGSPHENAIEEALGGSHE